MGDFKTIEQDSIFPSMLGKHTTNKEPKASLFSPKPKDIVHFFSNLFLLCPSVLIGFYGLKTENQFLRGSH